MTEAFREIEIKAAGDADDAHGTVMTEAFREAEKYIGNIPKFVKKNTSEGTKAFYGRLLSPCKNRKVIHVAGTNGKGSVCAYLQSVLMEAGYSVGMFTSPHLVDIRERIRVNGELISEEEFVQAFEQVKKHCGLSDIYDENHEADNLPVDYHPSYFEFLYFMAMLYFEKKQPDFIILETGLGGRLDATNSFASPCISIITEIGLDHTEYLGGTIAEIAAEKAGIVKKGIPLVYFANNKTVAAVMAESAKKAETRAFSVKSEEICLKKYDKKGIDFSYHTEYYKYSTFHLRTAALYQQENAALCIKAIAVLAERGIAEVSEEALQKGLAKAHWEGRMEEILPGVFVDGAHNPDGIAAFLRSVQADCGQKATMAAVSLKRICTDDGQSGRVLLYSSLKEKALKEMTAQIAAAGLFEEIVVTEIDNSRAADAEELAKLFEKGNVLVMKDVEEAFEYCLRERDMGRKVYITGSLYLVGKIKSLCRTERAHD